MAKKLKPSGLKPGDQVMMVNCFEAESEVTRGMIWLVASEPWDVCGSEVVKIKGKSGGFATKCLKKVEVV